jgi:hypothetical protein
LAPDARFRPCEPGLYGTTGNHEFVTIQNGSCNPSIVRLGWSRAPFSAFGDYGIIAVGSLRVSQKIYGLVAMFEDTVVVPSETV